METKKYKVLEAFELPGATSEDAATPQEVGAVLELTDLQAENLAGKVELVPAE